MAIIRLRENEAVQPQYVGEVDYANPIAKGLSGAFAQLGTGRFYDFVSGRFPATDATTTTTTFAGIGRQCHATGTKYMTFSVVPKYTLASALTVFAVLKVDALSSYTPIAACMTSATTHGWELRLGSNATGAELYFFRANTSGRSFIASASSLFTAPRQVTVAVKSNTDVITVSPTFFLNGRFYPGINGVGGGTGVQGVSTSSLYIGSRPSGATQLTGRVAAVYLWNRALGNDELLSLSANPWQVFRAPEVFIYTPQSTLLPGYLGDARITGMFYGASPITGIKKGSIPLWP